MHNVLALAAHAAERPLVNGRADLPSRSVASAEADVGPRQNAAIIQFSDQRLTACMSAALRGDRTAYDRLMRASIPLVRMMAYRQGVAADLVDDVVQETLLTVHRVRQTYDPNRPFTPWLKAIARRRAIDIMRSRGRSSVREVHEPYAFENHSDPAGNPEDSADQVARKDALGMAVTSLPTKQREAVEQLAFMGRSLADAAAATGLSPGALKVNLHRALTKLRDSATRMRAGASSEISKRQHVFVKTAV